MAYERLGDGALDYFPCRYGKSKLLFRGPRKKLDQPYVAAIGGTETYGKFMEFPYPAILEGLTDMPVVNLGCRSAGADVFAQDDVVIDICAGAKATVVQIMGAQNMSNRFYTVHPRRNDRFVKPSSLLKTIYRDVDYTEFHYTRHLLGRLKEGAEEKFNMVRDELRESWVARMTGLLPRLGDKVILVWMAAHSPDDTDATNDLDCGPTFVTRDMLNRVCEHASDYVEVVANRAEIDAGADRLIFDQLEEMIAKEMLGPVVHELAARRLQVSMGL